MGVECVSADVLDAAALSRALKGKTFDACISELTSLKKPPMFHRNMRVTNELRTKGTRNLILATMDAGAKRFLTQSMLFGYGYGDSEGKVYTEADRFAPKGQGKFEAHLAAMRINEKEVLGNRNLEGIALRYGLFYGVGAGDDQMVQALRKRQMPVLKNAGPLSWIYIDDAAAATVAALERGSAQQAYNIVDDEPVSWTAMMRALAVELDVKPPRALPAWMLAMAPYVKTMMQGGMRASNAWARRELQWTPEVPTYKHGVSIIAAKHRSA